MTSLHSDLGQSHRNKLRTRQSLLRAAHEETGPEPTNQDILTQSSPHSSTGHAFKRSPDKCFTETSEHKLSFRWEYTSECKVNGFLVTSFRRFGLPVIKQNFFPIYLKLGEERFFKNLNVRATGASNISTEWAYLPYQTMNLSSVTRRI